MLRTTQKKNQGNNKLYTFNIINCIKKQNKKKILHKICSLKKTTFIIYIFFIISEMFIKYLGTK